MLTLNAVNRWPVMDFDGTMGMKHSVVTTDGLSTPNAASTSDYTFYAVVRVDDLSVGVYRILWTYSYAGAVITMALHEGRPKYWDPAGATFVGDTGTGVTGWQILTYVLKSTASGFVRRNGATVSLTTLPWTKTAISTLGDFAIGCNAAGDIRLLDGAIAEMHLFIGAHAQATYESIEAHLAEKYAITI